MKRQAIAVDIDDVLAANAKGFVEYSNNRWGMNLQVEDYDEHFAKVWQTDAEETERRAVEFLHSGALGRYECYPEARAVLKKLGQDYELVVVTSRRSHLKSETEDWLKRWFPGLFSTIHYAGMWDTITEHSHTITKTELLTEIGADYLIDDQLKHCLAAADVGIISLLFGDYSWNRFNEPLPSNVVRVKDWAAVGEYFLTRKAVK